MSGPMPAVLAMAGRGRLPYATLHRSPLYLHALHALVAAGGHDVVVAVDEPDLARVTEEVHRMGAHADVRAGVGWWERLREADTSTGLLVHDALCPLASTDFIRNLQRHAAADPETSLLAYRPVTDTIKTVQDARIHGTIDREGLGALVSPAVVARGVLVNALADDDRPPVDDFARLAAWLRAQGRVELVRAPSLARRVDDASAVNLLECVDELARRVRREPGGITDAAAPGAR